ncbi:MAG: hypothetical protein JXJ20_04915 [Anaerolineae bacterium]|nr:hypothetical protein [Anaerolineae bacterium]
MTRRFPVTVWLFALALACVTSLPYVVGVLSAPEEGVVYSGLPALPGGVQWDFNSHFAKMWQGARGEFAYRLLFTHEDHPGLPLVQGFYVALGGLADLLPFGLPLIYHAARFLLAGTMVLALWAFTCRYFDDNRQRWLCMVFATLVSGWSWLLLLVAPTMTADVSPIEFWLVDAYNLLGAFYFPHFAAAICLQIVVFLTFEVWIERGEWRQIVVLTLALAAESLIQPYVILLTGGLLAILALVHIRVTRRLSWQRALWLAIPLGVHGGLILYQYLAMRADPVWSDFVAQNDTLSPPVIYYVLGYLPFLIPIALGFPVVWREAGGRWLLPLVWVGLVAVLLYAPFPTQRRYLLGVQTPLAVLAAQGWTGGMLPRISEPRRPLVTIVYLTFGSIASILIIFANTTALANPDQHEQLFYQPDERRAFDWLREQVDPGALVLTVSDRSAIGSGGRLVAMTGQRVYTGHWIETVGFDNKAKQVERFYDPSTPDPWRQAFLDQINARYVWYDDSARAVGAWNPAEADYLVPVFESASVTIYRVEP